MFVGGHFLEFSFVCSNGRWVVLAVTSDLFALDHWQVSNKLFVVCQVVLAPEAVPL